MSAPTIKTDAASASAATVTATTTANGPGPGPPPPRQIRFVHNQGQPPSKRRRINAACLTCRRRKTRCAGERPLCSTCTKNGHRCLGYPEEIKREDGAAAHDDGLDDDYPHQPDDDDKRAAKKPALAVARPPPSPPPRVSSTVVKPTDVGEQTPPTDSTEAAVTLDDIAGSPTMRRAHNHRIPYFRYFGPTAIVPGFKQMVVSVRDRRRSTGGSHSGTSPMSTPSNLHAGSSAAGSDVIVEDLPAYDINDVAPVHPLIIGLVKTFFLHVGCNYPFLQQTKFLAMLREKRLEPILVDAVCALAARFSDAPNLCGGNDKMPRTERGQIFAQRAKQATVDTFPCPSVGAVQACLLMAYEGFGANQDSALWMYLGLAIRMAMDLGLQRRIGIQYQGEKDPWNTRKRTGKNGESESPEEKKREEADTLSFEEQREVEQERIDTFWAVFVLDRVISSGTGRPVTFRDGDFDLAFPEPTIDPTTGWPAPFPIFLEIIHLYGRVCDILNNIHNIQDLTQDTWDKLTKTESHLTRLYKSWDSRLQFNVSNFKAYLHIGQGTTFILLHFWFHALFIVLHQPTLMSPFGELRSELQLLSDSRELSMSSAKTICDILAFADLIDPKSFIGNPFTSQPIYIAACAFLMESSASASEVPSREGSPPPKDRPKGGAKPSRHSMLASAANQNYQKCYNSLQHLNIYWGGVKYIITALDQKSKGIWDCETYTSEEYESTKVERRDNMSGQFPHFENQASPKPAGPPIAWTLAGTANSPNSSLTLMYQNSNGVAPSAPNPHPPLRQPSTPPGNMVYDPIRQSLPESGTMFPPAFPQPHTSAMRNSPRRPQHRRLSSLSNSVQPHPPLKYDGMPEEDEGAKMFMPGYTSSSQHSDTYNAYAVSPTTTMADPSTSRAVPAPYYSPGVSYLGAWGANGMGNMDAITFDSQDIDIGALGLQQPDLMNGWLDYIPGDVLGLFENPDMDQDAPSG